MRCFNTIRIVLILFVVASASVMIVRADNWPHWRGPTANGICTETNLPTQWSETKNIAWKLPMPGMAGSTPVIWGDRIFLTSEEGSDLVLMCVSTEGKPLWKKKLSAVTQARYMRGEGNQASASPTTDGKHVIAFVGSGVMACFDFEGNEIWKFNIQQRYGKFSMLHGIHFSPLLHGDRLYLSMLHRGGHWVAALDKATGKEIWKVARKTDAEGESRESYATPCLFQDGDQTYLVVLGADYATAHRLDDGAEVWRVGSLNNPDRYNRAFRIITSPVANEGLLIIPTARTSTVVAVKAGMDEKTENGKAPVLWQNNRGSPDVPSPVIQDGFVYLCSEGGVLRCWDAKTGKQVYEKSLFRDRYRASPVYADGKLYLTARSGKFSVVKAGPEFELLAENSLPDEFTASPAISNGRIYLRGFNALYAIENKEK